MGSPGACIVPANRYWRRSGCSECVQEQSLRQYSEDVLVSITFYRRAGAPQQVGSRVGRLMPGADMMLSRGLREAVVELPTPSARYVRQQPVERCAPGIGAVHAVV